MLFKIGHLVATPAVIDAIEQRDISNAIARHAAGDWGDVSKADYRANNRAVKDGSRILSVYKSTNGKNFWIISESDRSATTILLPSDY